MKILHLLGILQCAQGIILVEGNSIHESLQLPDKLLLSCGICPGIWQGPFFLADSEVQLPKKRSKTFDFAPFRFTTQNGIDPTGNLYLSIKLIGRVPGHDPSAEVINIFKSLTCHKIAC